MTELGAWLGRDIKPLGKKPKETAAVGVNLSQGTGCQHACWLMLYWNGSFGTPAVDVTFLQGDGGADRQPDLTRDEARRPLRTVDVSRYSRIRTEPTADQVPVGHVVFEKLRSPAYQKLADQLDRAAALGSRTVLVGERGSGKTYVAEFYHRLRQEYRKQEEPFVVLGATGKTTAKKGTAHEKPGGLFVPVSLAEFGSVEQLGQELFGWKKGAFTGADEDHQGAILRAHGGTLFLDEIHHLDQSLQAALLSPLNDGTVRVKGNAEVQQSEFDLVTATNDPKWRGILADDFRDRIEHLVLELPSFNELRRTPEGRDDLLEFFERVLKLRFARCRISGVGIPDRFRDRLRTLCERRNLPGNWRLFQRLVEYLLLESIDPRGGKPREFEWSDGAWELAVDQAFA